VGQGHRLWEDREVFSEPGCWSLLAVDNRACFEVNAALLSSQLVVDDRFRSCFLLMHNTHLWPLQWTSGISHPLQKILAGTNSSQNNCEWLTKVYLWRHTKTKLHRVRLNQVVATLKGKDGDLPGKMHSWKSVLGIHMARGECGKITRDEITMCCKNFCFYWIVFFFIERCWLHVDM